MLLTWKIIEMEVLKHCGLMQKNEISKVLISYFRNTLNKIKRYFISKLEKSWFEIRLTTFTSKNNKLFNLYSKKTESISYQINTKIKQLLLINLLFQNVS